MQPITPYTDPALEYLGEYLANWLNANQPDMVAHWIASEIASPKVGDYPLLQLQCLGGSGEAFEHCKGSIRYITPNQMLRSGDRQQFGYRYQAALLARGLRIFDEQTDWEKSPIKIKRDPDWRWETRGGVMPTIDGGGGQPITWVEVFFDYSDCSPIDC
jgi:hypothetical protein